jgi:peptide/nickel transport system permease protein
MSAFAKAIRGEKLFVLSCGFLAIVTAAAIFAPSISPYDPAQQDLTAAKTSPSLAHPLGTDFQGGDVLSKVIFGSRQVVIIAAGVSASTVAIGFALGLLAGYIGGRVDTLTMRAVDVMLAFPALLLNIILVALLGASLESLFLSLTLTGWAGVARITRGLVIGLKNAPYVTGARAVGATGMRIVMRHIVPNCASTITVVLAMRAGSALLGAGALGYLGLGDPSDTNAWGTMVNLGQYDIVTAWWWPVFPATALAASVISINFIADGLRDRLDPRMKERVA